MAGALSGLVIADFTRVLAGPYATMLLGDLGAQVIKIERPNLGDDTRSWGPPFDSRGTSTYFQSVNRNKDSVTIDLSSDAGFAQAREIILKADVIIHNFAPQLAEKFQLDYKSVKEISPQIIYCAITGFGAGEGAKMPGYDLLVQAMGGLMSVTGSNEPTKVGVAVVDVITGLHAAIGILSALHHRTTTGLGQSVEVNLLSSILSGMVNQSSGFVSADVAPQLIGNAHPSIAPYEVYQCADRALVIAVGNDAQFVKLCSALGLAELSDDVRFSTNSARVKNREALNSFLSINLKKYAADYWIAQLAKVAVPCGPINTIAEAFALAQGLGLEPIVDIQEGNRIWRQVANPITLSETPAEYRDAPPELGENNNDWLQL